MSENRKIEAIKLLREERGVDLKEAKEEVEAFMANNESVYARRRPVVEDNGVKRLALILVMLAFGGISNIFQITHFRFHQL